MEGISVAQELMVFNLKDTGAHFDDSVGRNANHRHLGSVLQTRLPLSTDTSPQSESAMQE